MTRTRQYIVVLLMIVLSMGLAGCSKDSAGKKESKNNQEKAKGCYVEEILKSPQGFTGFGSMNIQEDGSFLIIDAQNGTVNTSPDGKEWKIKKPSILQKLLKQKEVEITSAAAGKNGEVFLSYVSWDQSTKKKRYPERYIYIDQDGKGSEFELGIEGYSTSAMESVMTNDLRVYLLCNNSKLYEVDLLKKKLLKKIDTENLTEDALFSYGDTIAVNSGKGIFVYDKQKGEMQAADEVLNNSVKKADKSGDFVVLGGNDEKKIFMATREGIYSHVINGKVMEQLAEGNLTSLGESSQTASELFVTKEGKIIILYADGKLAAYTYDADAASVPDKQLTIYSLYDNATVRQAISVFREKNPDVYVRLELGVSSEDGVTASDAIKNLNTELLSGNGPDLLMLDGMPLDSYIEKGVLEKLDDLVEGLEKDSSYYENILEAYGREDGIYAVPIRFELPLLAGNQEILSGITDIKSLADAIEQQGKSGDLKGNLIGGYTPKEILLRLYPVCENAWFEEDGSLNEDALEEYLTQAKRIYDTEQKHIGSAEQKQHAKVLARLDASQFGYCAELYGAELQLYEQLSGMQLLAAGEYDSMKSLQTLVSMENRDKTMTHTLFQGQGKNVFISSGIAGIVSDSKEKDLAKAFLETLLGDRVQEKDLGDGFPVHQDAFEVFSKNPNPDSDGIWISMGKEEANPEVNLQLVWPKKSELEQLEALFAALEKPADLDSNMREEIVTIGSSVLSGEKGIKDGKAEIASKISLIGEE